MCSFKLYEFVRLQILLTFVLNSLLFWEESRFGFDVFMKLSFNDVYAIYIYIYRPTKIAFSSTKKDRVNGDGNGDRVRYFE